MTTFTYILGLVFGALLTSTVFYILKLRKEVNAQERLLKEQHKLIEILTIKAFGDEIKEHLGKGDCCGKESVEPQPETETDDSAHTTNAESK